MKISAIIAALDAIQKEHGDLEVKYDCPDYWTCGSDIEEFTDGQIVFARGVTGNYVLIKT